MKYLYKIEEVYDPLGNSWKERTLRLARVLDELGKWAAVTADPPHQIWEKVAHELRTARKSGDLP